MGKIVSMEHKNFRRVANVKSPRLRQILVTQRTIYRLSKVSFFRGKKHEKASQLLPKITEHLDWYVRKLLPSCTSWRITGSFAHGHRLEWLVKEESNGQN
jgi:hypothetical protein